MQGTQECENVDGYNYKEEGRGGYRGRRSEPMSPFQ